MAIRQWHAGRITLLWLAAGLLVAFFSWVIGPRNNPSEAFVIVLLFAAIGSLVLAFVVSWIWFGGRERK
jgi:hypothetical protein